MNNSKELSKKEKRSTRITGFFICLESAGLSWFLFSINGGDNILTFIIDILPVYPFMLGLIFLFS